MSAAAASERALAPPGGAAIEHEGRVERVGAVVDPALERAATRPRDAFDLSRIHGVGPAKIASYGDKVLEVVAGFADG